MKQEILNITTKFEDFLKKKENSYQGFKDYSFKRKKRKLIHYLFDTEEHSLRTRKISHC